jgi:uncharacterized membrane protein
MADKMDESEDDNIIEPISKEATEILEELPAKEREVAERAIHLALQYSYRGPIPHPSIITPWEEILPGSADRILKMAEKEQANQHDGRMKRLNADILYERLGLATAFSIAVITICGALYVIIIGKDATGLNILLGSLAALVGLFIAARWNKRSAE